MLNSVFSLIDILFSFEGRMRRLHFWVCHIGMNLVAWSVFIGFFFAFFGPAVERVEAGEDSKAVIQSMDPVEINLFFLVIALLYAGFTWSSYAVSAKRWHDRDKSGLWSFITFVPIVGPLWMLIECGFLPGTVGPNRFGDPPGNAPGNLIEVFE